MNVCDMSESMYIFSLYDPGCTITFFEGGFYVPVHVTDQRHKDILSAFGWQEVRMGSLQWLTWRIDLTKETQ